VGTAQVEGVVKERVVDGAGFLLLERSVKWP